MDITDISTMPIVSNVLKLAYLESIDKKKYFVNNIFYFPKFALRKKQNLYRRETNRINTVNV